MELTRKMDDYKSDTHPYSYKFTQGDDYFIFYQSGNLDLNFLCVSENNEVEFVIDIYDNYHLYKIFDEMYNNLINNYKHKYGYKELFEKGFLYWKSDAPANELSCDEFIYNYLKITKEGNIYKLTLINNTDYRTFVVEMNTDRSRYGILVYEFWAFLKHLEQITEPYQQITIEQYLLQKTKGN